MNRKCKSCGLIFQTVTSRAFSLCHRCFMARLERSFMLLIPHLWELSDEKLSDLIGLCNTMHECAVQERKSRDGYVNRLLAGMEKP